MKKVLALLLIVIMACFAVACGANQPITNAPAAEASQPSTDAPAAEAPSAPASEKKIKIGYVSASYTEDDFGLLTLQNFQRIVKKDFPGWEVLAQEAKWDVSKELAIAESFIQEGCDVIIFHASDDDGTSVAVQAANKAGIPVISIINRVKRGDLIYVGGSNYDCGVLLAETIRDKIPQNGKICLMMGMASATNVYERIQGFKDNLKRSDVEILDEQNGDWLVEKAMSITENWIQAYPKIDLIFSVSDTMTPGVVQALKGANRLDETMVVSVDGSKIGLDMVKNGEVELVMLYNSTKNAQNAVNVCERIINGEKDIEDVFDHFDPITKNEVDELLEWYFIGE